MDWTHLRNLMPVTRRWAFFDHAAVAPWTEPARQALAEWAADLTDNGDLRHGSWMRRVEAVREQAARLLHAEPSDVAFVKNTSEGIGIVAEGLPWRAGDNMVTADDEYPANVYPWMNLRDRGVEVRRVPGEAGRITVDDVRELMDDRTRLVSLSFVEFATGFRNDLDSIGGLCRERGVLFFVDAIQGLGVLPLDVTATPIDFLAADGHKWLLGPEGAGLFWVRRELVDHLHAVGVGWNSVVDSLAFDRVDFRLKPHAGRWESGTLNVGGILALGASLGLLLDIGIAAIAERIFEITTYLCERVRQVGVEAYSSRQPREWSGIVSLVVGGDPNVHKRRCRDAGVLVNQRAGRLRVSPHAYNTHDEIDRLVDVLGAMS